MPQHTVTLQSNTDWPGFRHEARALLGRLVPPESVTWHTPQSAEEDLFAPGERSSPPSEPATSQRAKQAVVSPSFISLCQTVILHSDPGRFGLLYRLLWRMMHEPGLRNDALDPDRMQALHMAQSVRRDMHKMKAFVRFRTVNAGDLTSALRVAWFEPAHHIVEAVAPFFSRRFTQMRWAILTPERSVRWDGHVLEFGPGGDRDQAPPPDAGEALWLVYYRNIFNPARLKMTMMQKEMPRKYWHNLPEAALIDSLAATAALRTDHMIEAPATMPTRRIRVPERASAVRLSQAAPASAWPLELPADPTEALAVLRAATDRCRDCPIGEHATQSVFGEGPPRAGLMVVGEQPGDQEDLRGRPFVGPAGQLFERAVAHLGWARDQLYVTNAVKHFKFELRGKRRIHKTPGQREAAACLHWLESEIEQVQPRALIALGATAARALLGRKVAVMQERGQWHAGTHGQQVLVTIHPSALLRMDEAERESAYQAWLEDLSQATRFQCADAATDTISR